MEKKTRANCILFDFTFFYLLFNLCVVMLLLSIRVAFRREKTNQNAHIKMDDFTAQITGKKANYYIT